MCIRDRITFYGPLENNYKYGRQVDLNVRQENKYSIVTRIVYGKNSFLMTGDAQRETIEKIIKKGYNLQAQVLKEPHHGYQDVKEKDKLIAGRTSDHKLLIEMCIRDRRFPDGDFAKHAYLQSAYTKDKEAALKWKEELMAEFPEMEFQQDPLSLSVACHIGAVALAEICIRDRCYTANIMI